MRRKDIQKGWACDFTCAHLGLVIEIEREHDKNERNAEKHVQLEMEDQNRERRCDEHRARDEEETRDVARMLHHGGHDEPDECLRED